MDEMYHTALKSKFDTKDVPVSTRVSGDGYVFLRSDLVVDGIPDEVADCDVIYGEPPWPHGFKVFNDRAEVSDRRTYQEFADVLGSEIRRIRKPFYMTLGKTLMKMLPSHSGSLPVKLNGADAFIVWWFDKYDGPHDTNISVCKALGARYRSMGDWCCGYATPLLAFTEGGGKLIVGADYDGKCITVCGERMGN